MDFTSTTTIMVFIAGAVLLDAVLMFWLRSKKKSRHGREGVTLFGQYSPLLTVLNRMPDWFRLFKHPGQAVKELGAGFSRRAASAWMSLTTAVRRRGRLLRPALMASAVGSGLAGQVQLFRDHNLPGGLLWLLLSAGSWLAWGLFQKRDDESLSPPVTRETPPPSFFLRGDFRTLAVLLALQMTALAVGLYWNRPEDSSHADIFSLWAAGMAAYLLAFWPASSRPAWTSFVRSNWKRLIPIILIFILAAGLRFYQLGELPPVMENDEGIVGMRVLEVISGERRNMFDVYGGYGSMYFFLQSLPVRFLGQNMLALRVVTALAGTLAIPLAAWSAWRFFGYRVALAASVLLAASHLHVHFSRVSPTAGSFDPLFASALALLLYEALTSRRPHLWAAAGVLMGLALHFYVGARALPAIVLAVLGLLLILRREYLRGQARGLLVMTGALAVSAGPLLSWAMRNPDGFNQRINQVGILQNGWLLHQITSGHQTVFEALAGQLGNALLIFNYHPAGWFYQASVPAMGFTGGLLLWFGLILGLTRLRRLPFLLVSAWFWVTLFTGQVLMVDPPPNAYRTLGLMPAVCMLAAAAGEAFCGEVGRLLPGGGRKAAAALLAALVLMEGGWNIYYYFGVWNGAGTYGDENTRRASLMGSFLGSQNADMEVMIAGDEEFKPDGWRALNFLRGGTEYIIVEAPLAESVPALRPSPAALVLAPESMRAELEQLKALYPAGVATPHWLEGKFYFWSYELNGE
jgi:4-amino-4-deoxy-L-arabinose transferase-like glycosyltransferase